jgi:hypothetical protein
MIIIPSVATLPHARLYRDSGDTQVIYVDLLHPAPAKGDSATRWMPIPDALAYLVGEVRFGPGPEGFGNVPQITVTQRLLPVPWEISPVFAWYREGDGVQVVARGKTSGFGQSNAVLSGTAPLKAMISPVLISTELMCQGRLSQGQVRGKGTPVGLDRALAQAALGRRAEWDVPLGKALVQMLAHLVGSGDLTLHIAVDHPEPKAAQVLEAELRQLALLEWAHRLQELIAAELTLAAPAALVTTTGPVSLPSFDLVWAAGAHVTLRAIRILRAADRPVSIPKN